MGKHIAYRYRLEIAKSHGVVVVEDLKITAMTRSARGTPEEPGAQVAQKRGLNRSILAQGWGEFERQLDYKCERAGGTLVGVPAPYTSQRCAACGAVDAASREGRRFACVACGHRADADVNAARNILAARQAVTVREAVAGGHGEEPRTTRRELARAA